MAAIAGVPPDYAEVAKELPLFEAAGLKALDPPADDPHIGGHHVEALTRGAELVLLALAKAVGLGRAWETGVGHRYHLAAL